MIAQRAGKMLFKYDIEKRACIDIAPYALNKSLRMPFSHKLSQDGKPIQ
jgi:hypothetical protein